MPEIVGHQQPLEGFANAVAKGRLSGTFLLVGPPGIGKATVAKTISKALLCERIDPSAPPRDRLRPCEVCESCVQVEADSHPDFIQVRKPDDRAYIPLELLIGPPDSRMQEGFCRNIRLRPFRGTRKLAILHDADFLNEEGANSLLKTLEEPPPDAVLFLIATNEQRQLPTIRSRCRVVRMRPPVGDDARKLMLLHGVECDQTAALNAIELCGGDCQAAASLLSGQADAFRKDFARQLQSRPMPVVELAKYVGAYVDEAGKEAPQRRDRLRDVLSIATATFREELKQVATDSRALAIAIYRIDRTIDAIGHVQRNANQSTLIESWASDVARGHEV
jgi:DNA polymerase III subunit delta'